LPFPPNKGDKIRSYALLKHLARRGPVHLACFIDDKEDLKYRDDVRQLAGGECLFETVEQSMKWKRAFRAIIHGAPVTTAYFASSAMRQWVREIVATKEIDSTIVFGSAMAPYLLQDPVHCRRAILDMVDVDSDKWQQYAQSSTGPMRWIYAREARTVATLEIESANAFGRTLLVSPFEAETFRGLAPNCAERIGVVSNGVDLTTFSPGPFSNPFPKDELPIVMTGHMNYRPNCDGALWFAGKVVPLIVARFPRAHIYFVGARPPSALRAVSGPNITVTGRVDDVRPYIHSAQVIVAPLLIARGIQNKVLEAMAMRKCVVTTREAARALAVESARHLWIANDPQSFADAVAAAIQSPDRDTVMENARGYVQEHHDWDKIFSALDTELTRLACDDTKLSGGAQSSLCRATHFPVATKSGAKA
jgi:sugar transferase (PEP-CTERM/EpsH1 system associated)